MHEEHSAPGWDYLSVQPTPADLGSEEISTRTVYVDDSTPGSYLVDTWDDENETHTTGLITDMRLLDIAMALEHPGRRIRIQKVSPTRPDEKIPTIAGQSHEENHHRSESERCHDQPSEDSALSEPSGVDIGAHASTTDFPENMRTYFQQLYYQFQERQVPFHDALDRIPLPAFYFLAGTPGRIGSAIEEHGSIATHDPAAPVKMIRSMAVSVLSLVTHLQGNGDDPDTREAIEFQWTMLRSFVYNGVAPQRSQQWASVLVKHDGLEELVVRALEQGATIYNDHRLHCFWRHDSWESDVLTTDIVGWFRQACSMARRWNTAT